jgi:MFS family permease
LTTAQNTALYSAFAVFGFFGGTFINKLGVRWTLAFGGIGYSIYAISLLVSVHASVAGFNLFAGTWLGICAALLWTAQGTIMISYPTEEQKGRYFAWFWGIFNMGAVIGSLVRSCSVYSYRVTNTQLDSPRRKYPRQDQHHCFRRYLYRLHRPDGHRCPPCSLPLQC